MRGSEEQVYGGAGEEQVSRWIARQEEGAGTSGGRVEYDRRPINGAEKITSMWLNFKDTGGEMTETMS